MLLRNDTFRGLCQARDLLAEASEVPLSIRDLAREKRISPFHFIRQYQKLFGMTPHQFRIQARMDRAKLLLESGNSVTDVCMEVGMSSVGSFSDLFTRRVGVAPSQYRRRALEEPPFPGCLGLMAAAYRNFEEAKTAECPVKCGHEDQTDQPDGGRSG